MEPNRLSPIRRRVPIVAQVHHALRQAVLARQFMPGQRLVETELAEMLGVSRTPVREALSKLEVEGLVEALPAGGVMVRDLVAELAEIYGLRQRLEGYAANLAAQRIQPEELERLRAACRVAREALDTHSLAHRAELNNIFHRLLIEASHSPRLIRLGHDFRDYSLSEQNLRLYDRETAMRHHRQHEQIVEAIAAGDGDLAERLVYEHLESALSILQSAWHDDATPAEEQPGEGGAS